MEALDSRPDQRGLADLAAVVAPLDYATCSQRGRATRRKLMADARSEAMSPGSCLAGRCCFFPETGVDQKVRYTWDDHWGKPLRLYISTK